MLHINYISALGVALSSITFSCTKQPSVPEWIIEDYPSAISDKRIAQPECVLEVGQSATIQYPGVEITIEAVNSTDRIVVISGRKYQVDGYPAPNISQGKSGIASEHLKHFDQVLYQEGFINFQTNEELSMFMASGSMAMHWHLSATGHIVGYANHGDGRYSLRFYKAFLAGESVKPDMSQGWPGVTINLSQ